MKPIAQLKVCIIPCVALLVMLGSGTPWAGTGFWTSLGLEDRWILSLAIDPKNPNILYVGTALFGTHNGTVLKSTNDGARWSEISLGFPTINVSALVLDYENPSTIYAGTSGRGLFKSTDAGATWVNPVLPGALPVNQVARGINLPEANFIVSLAIDPKDPRTVYAGSSASCCPWSSWVFKSTDAGASWVASPLTAAAVTSLAIDPQDPRIVYAGHADSLDGEVGISKSVDGGMTWIDVGTVVDGNVNGLAIDPVHSGTVYAATMSWGGREVGYVGRVLKSSDGGASWLSTGPPPMAADPQHPNGAPAVVIDLISPTTQLTLGRERHMSAAFMRVRMGGQAGSMLGWLRSGLLLWPSIPKIRTGYLLPLSVECL